MEESKNNVTEQPVISEKTTTKKPSEIKKIINEVEVEEQKIVEEVKFHVRDFLLKTKAMRDEFNIFEKKFFSLGVKTIEEWEKLTGLISKK